MEKAVQVDRTFQEILLAVDIGPKITHQEKTRQEKCGDETVSDQIQRAFHEGSIIGGFYLFQNGFDMLSIVHKDT